MNKKWMKWLTSLTLVASLVVPQMASADTNGKVTVKVRVFGPHGLNLEQYVQVGAESFTNTDNATITLDKPTALGALVELLKENRISYAAKTSSFGTYVSQIGDVAEKTINSNTGWTDWVDGQAPSIGADQTLVKNGDEIVWAFNDYTQTLYPHVQLDSNRVKTGSDITIHVTAQQTTYDANWNATTKTVPVVGADVLLSQPGATQTPIVTDANGDAKIPVDREGLISFHLNKFDADGLPLVIDSGTINVMAVNPNLNFDDLNGYGWAAASIQTLAGRGAIHGNGQGQFLPGGAVSRGEFATMIALNGDLSLGGAVSPVDLSAHDAAWLQPYVTTVLRNGTMTLDDQGRFFANGPVPREQLAIILDRLAGLQPATDTSGLTFKDLGSIDSYALPYVKTAVQNGLLVGDDQGKFRPHDTITRAEAAMALGNVLNFQATK